jgi:hypothetical protein
VCTLTGSEAYSPFLLEPLLLPLSVVASPLGRRDLAPAEQLGDVQLSHQSVKKKKVSVLALSLA